MLTTVMANDKCFGCYPTAVPSFGEHPGVWATAFIVLGAWLLLILGMCVLGPRLGAREGPPTSDGSATTATPPEDNHRVVITGGLGVTGGAFVVTGFLILLLS